MWNLLLRFGATALGAHAVVLLTTLVAFVIVGIPLSDVPIAWIAATLGGSSILTAWLLARYVARPVADLARAAERMALGSLVIDVPGRPQTDDLCALVGSFEELVSNLRSTQDELRNARAYVVRVLESIPEAVIVAERHDAAELRFCNLNRAAVDILGHARETLVGQPLDLVFRESSDLIGRLDERGQIRGIDTRLTLADGTTREVRLSASRVATPTSSGEGAHGVYVLVASDVSESRRNERRRIASYRLSELVRDAETPKELLRGVEGVLRDAIYIDAFHVAIVDDRTSKISIPHFADPRVTELTQDEVTSGLTGYVMSAEAAVIMSSDQIRMLVENGETKAVTPLAEHWASARIQIDGQAHGVLVVQSFAAARPFLPGDIDLLAFAAEQVAAFFRRRHAEDEKTRLSAAIEHAVDAVLILDGERRVAYANPAFEKQSGFPRAEVVGRTLDDLWVEDERQTPLASIWRVVGGGRAWTGRTQCRRSDGSTFQTEVTLSSVRDREGGVVEFIVVQHDISNELLLEDQLRQAQKMEAIGLLAGGVAHDFNNLLSVIHGYGELLRSRTVAEDAKTWLGEVLKAAERASDLVGQLLAFSRRQVIEPRALDLGVVVSGVKDMLGRLIGEDVRLITDIRTGLDMVEADPGQVEQILLNLIVNARDAMPRGGEIRVRVENVDLDAEAARLLPGLEAGPHVALCVTDTGAGIPPEIQKRIFEPFFTTKPQGQGTGLGLSTVYGVVKQAGGHIRVESQLGHGTEFSIFIPSVGRAAPPPMDGDESSETQMGTETVLVVEDEVALRVYVHRVLTLQGYQVLVAESGAQALEIARGMKGPLDLLLTDVIMPNMNGSTLAATLSEVRPDTAVLYMSGYPDASIASYGVLDPDVDLLQKPFPVARLLKRVRRAIDVHRRRRKRRTVAPGMSPAPVQPQAQ